MKALRWTISLVMFAGALLAASRISDDWDRPSDPNHHRAIIETVAAMLLAAPLLVLLSPFNGRTRNKS